MVVKYRLYSYWYSFLERGFILSVELQLILVCFFCYFLPLIISVLSFCFEWVEDAHGKYIIACIISLIFFLGYIIFSYKQSSPLMCDIVNYILNVLHSLNGLTLVIMFICFMVIPSLSVFILLFISNLLGKFSERLDKFIHWLKKHSKDN